VMGGREALLSLCTPWRLPFCMAMQQGRRACAGITVRRSKVQTKQTNKHIKNGCGQGLLMVRHHRAHARVQGGRAEQLRGRAKQLR
jgi:hypothetical protein